MVADMELIFSRLLMILGGLFVGGIGFLWVQRRVHPSQMDRQAQNYLKGRSIVLYFSIPSAAPCEKVQQPALEQVKTEMAGRIEIVEVDVREQPNFARSWGVFSVPTIFILDPQGKVRHINHGVTLADKLIKQLQGL
ncbi:MAG TPA: thioredoxin family protein [Anaerolineales bacterium]|nr:thioredoxin family protein [Anaerolineales bacterium]